MIVFRSMLTIRSVLRIELPSKSSCSASKDLPSSTVAEGRSVQR